MAMGRWWKRRRLDLDDDDFKAEVEAHLAMAEAERVAEGTDWQAAHYAALKDFGNVTLTTEAARQAWTPGWPRPCAIPRSDLRYAVRSLVQHKGFAATVVGVLAVGIGVNAAVFTMLKSIAFTPPAWRGPVGQPPRHPRRDQHRAAPPRVVSRYLRSREHDRAFSGLFGLALATVTLGRGRSARQVSGELVTGTTSTCSASAPSAAASCRRPTRWRPASIRSSSSATVCGAPTSAPIPTSSAPRS